MRRLLLGIFLGFALALPSPQPHGTAGAYPFYPQQKRDSKLQDQLKKLSEAFVKRDLAVIKTQISPARLYVQIADKAGAYLSSGQTLVVMESFLRTRTVVSASFDFVSEDGTNGSASGTLSTLKAGRIYSYRLNFGFTKNDKDIWLLSKISVR
jgi:hypothetical protein